MSSETKTPVLPQWAMIALLLGSGGAGVSALGMQTSTEPVATQAEVDKLERSVDALAVAVMELTIEVRSGRAGQ